jgi:hypothetical protein
MIYYQEKSGELEITVSDESAANNSVILGGVDPAEHWEEYLDSFKDKYQPHVQLIRSAIEALGWVGDTAEKRANDVSFHFSDGEVWDFTWRAWGDLMSAIVDKKEGYMKYYM